MLPELLWLCFEPKQMNNLLILEHLFSESSQNEKEHSDFLNAKYVKNLENDNSQQHCQKSSNDVITHTNQQFSPYLNHHFDSSTINHLTSLIPKDMSNYWQSNYKSIRERNAILFNNEYMSDITFLVGNEMNKEDQQVLRIPAHKFVLATGSSVFYAMFYGALAEKSSKIQLPDVDPEGFLSLLKYLYCDDICIDKENVIHTLYCSKIYIVPFLSNACISFLTEILNSKNVCLLLSQIKIFDEEKEFIKNCLELIDCQPELALSSSTFIDIDGETLKFILERETLNINKQAIYEACLRWADAECRRQNLDSTNPKNKHKVLRRLISFDLIETTKNEK